MKVFRRVSGVGPKGLENVHGSATPPSDSAVGKRRVLGVYRDVWEEVSCMVDLDLFCCRACGSRRIFFVDESKEVLFCSDCGEKSFVSDFYDEWCQAGEECL